MEDQRKKTGAGAAGGTLQDEAASGGEEPVSFGKLMMGDFNGGEKDGESVRTEAISSTYLLSGSQGRNEISEILARKEGDSEVFMSEDGAGRTVYQQRILEAARAAREQYFEARETKNAADMARHGARLVRFVDALTKEGLSEAPGVKELIAEEDVNELSVVLDAETVANALKMHGEGPTRVVDPGSFSKELLDSAREQRDLEGELNADLERDGIKSLLPDEPVASPEVGGVRGEEPVEDAQIESAATLAEPFAQPEWMNEHLAEPPPLPAAGEAEDNSIDGRTTNAPEPIATQSNRELEKISVGGLSLTPLREGERGRIGKLNELSSGELKEMAAARREQAEIAFGKQTGERKNPGRWYIDLAKKLQDEGVDNEEFLRAMSVAKVELLKQADQLDMLAAKRYTVSGAQTGAQRREPIMPARPKPLRASVSPRRASAAPQEAAPSTEEVDDLVGRVSETTERNFFDTGDSGAFSMFAKPDGSIDIQKLYGMGGPAYVMGTSGDPAKRRDRTELGMPAVNLDTADGGGKPREDLGKTRGLVSGAVGSGEHPTGIGVVGNQGKPKSALGRTGLFGEFDNDPEMDQIAEEGSGALKLDHIRELSGAQPVPDPISRIPTGQMKAAGNLASLEGTGIAGPEQISDELRAVQRASAEAAAGKLGETAVVAPESITGADGGKKVWGEHAFANTRLSSVEAALGAQADGKLGAKTKNERPKEDFSIYGDIYYTVEKVYMETTGIPPELNSLNNFTAMLPDAIKKAEMLAKAAKSGELDEGEKLKKGETQIIRTEEARVARLRIFQEDFLRIPEGKEEPKKSLLAYNEWLANKRQEYSGISDVHKILGKTLTRELKGEHEYGVSPGEYGRIGMLRLCNAAIKSGELTEQEDAKVGKLREMLEPAARGEKDIFAQTIAADATYEMIVGFATKQERATMRQLQQELGKYKITVAEYEEKRDLMVKVLAEVLVSVRSTEASATGIMENAAGTKEKIKKAIMALEPTDALERIKYMKLIQDAQAGKGGDAGKELRKKADRLAATIDIPAAEVAEIATQAAGVSAVRMGATPLGKSAEEREEAKRKLEEHRAAFYGDTDPRRIPQAQAVPHTKAPKQYGPIASGIGTAIKVAVGAGLVVGTLWLSEHGIIALGTRADTTAQKPVAAQVEKAAEETPDELPAGIAVDAGKVLAKNEAAAKKDAGVGAMVAPASKKDAGVAPDAGVDQVIKTVRELQPVQPPVVPEKYARDKTGLKAALDDWCQEEHGLLVSGKMLRAAYASIEGGLDGKILPQDMEWQSMVLKMRFPNRFVELAVMSDIARGSAESDDIKTKQGLLAEKYAAYMRLAVILGDKAGNPKSFGTSIKEANAKGLGLPPLDSESHIGRLEAVKVGERCLFAAYYKTVKATMAQIKETALETGLSAKEFTALVRASLGGIAERIEKLADSANYQASQESKLGSCEALTGGKRGAAALERAGVVSEKWEENHERAKAKADEYQKGVDDVLGSAPNVKTNAPKYDGKKVGKKSSCAGKTGDDQLTCFADERIKAGKSQRDNGEKMMTPPKNGGGSASKAPHGPVRY